MRRFDINKLPKEVREKISDIQWAIDEEDMCGLQGQVNLKDGYEFIMGGHIEGFENRADLIKMVKNCVVEERR